VLDRVEAQFESGAVADQAFGGIIGVGKVVLSAVFSALIVFVLTLYFLASLPQAKRACYRLVPASRRERVSLLGDEVLSRVGGYVAGAFIVATIAGLSAMAFCMAIGLGEYAIALGMVVAVTDFIPLSGRDHRRNRRHAIGFVTSPGIGVACLVFFVVYQQLENYVIYPRVMSSSSTCLGGSRSSRHFSVAPCSASLGHCSPSPGSRPATDHPGSRRTSPRRCLSVRRLHTL
jgi:predicted PurR-regulated permease PerM